jgi:hypothetical protein
LDAFWFGPDTLFAQNFAATAGKGPQAMKNKYLGFLGPKYPLFKFHLGARRLKPPYFTGENFPDMPSICPDSQLLENSQIQKLSL